MSEPVKISLSLSCLWGRSMILRISMNTLGVYRVFHDPYHYQEKNIKSQMWHRTLSHLYLTTLLVIFRSEFDIFLFLLDMDKYFECTFLLIHNLCCLKIFIFTYCSKCYASVNYSSFLNADDADHTPVPEERLILYQPLNDNDPSGTRREQLTTLRGQDANNWRPSGDKTWTTHDPLGTRREQLLSLVE
jgi:hypothetical protein